MNLLGLNKIKSTFKILCRFNVFEQNNLLGAEKLNDLIQYK